VFVIALIEQKIPGKWSQSYVSDEKTLRPMTGFESSAMKFRLKVEAESYLMLFVMKYRDYFGRLQILKIKG
jgi:hypothetical protein